jgi:biopolymer transport protein ExbD
VATRKARRLVVTPDMNVTPLVDVVLVLLIIFMVVAPQLDQDVQVNLPGIFNVDPEVEGNMDPVKISVAEPGKYYIDERPFDMDGAVRYLIETQAADPNRRLLLRADSKLRYGEVRSFMARIQQAGFPGLNFMVGEKHKEGMIRATATYGDTPGAQPGGTPPDATGAGDAAGTTPSGDAPTAPPVEPAPATTPAGS